MRIHVLSLLALTATVVAQDNKPKISADELVESIVVLTEAVQDAVEMTSELPSEAEAVKVSCPSLCVLSFIGNIC